MAEQTDGKLESAGAEVQQGQFGMQKIYIKDISFETPHSPQIFKEQWNPAVNMEITNNAKVIEDDMYEVVLAVTVTVRSEEKIVYLVEIHQAGIFHILGFPGEILNRMLATVCPNILFPFAREVVADLIMRGGFPQLLLAPVNFDALYQQQQQQQQQTSAEADAEEMKH
ncbi:MAG: protein-export chaperone SecB [Gammaproteobacteria bacterium]|nr:protein-export chaperone SecB [Gammaproteobacteria bacterium]